MRPPGQWTAGAADAVHGDLLRGLAGRGGGRPSRLIPLLASAALVTTRDRAQDRPQDCSPDPQPGPGGRGDARYGSC
jgi:hypothetical protein